MPKGKCNNHGIVEAEWKEIKRKTDGKEFKFWGCPHKEKDANGNWIKCRVEMEAAQFDKDLHKAAVQNDSLKKDVTITRLAIAKSLIEAGYKHGLEAMTEFKWWIDVVEGRNPIANTVKAAENPIVPTGPEQRPMTNADVVPTEAPVEEIRLEDVPF